MDYSLKCPDCGEPLHAILEVIIPMDVPVQLHELDNLFSYYVDLDPELFAKAARTDYSWEIVEFTCPACGESWSPHGLHRALTQKMKGQKDG